MRLSTLALKLSAHEKLEPTAAYTWAWRIQNDYPAPLCDAAEAWAQDKPLPQVTIEGVSLEQVQASTGMTPLAALDLLYVMSRSAADGKTILMRCTLRDQKN